MESLFEFYQDNQREIDASFVEYVFYEGRFEFQDQNRMFNNDTLFWEFVERFKDRLEAINVEH